MKKLILVCLLLVLSWSLFAECSPEYIVSEILRVREQNRLLEAESRELKNQRNIYEELYKRSEKTMLYWKEISESLNITINDLSQRIENNERLTSDGQNQIQILEGQLKESMKQVRKLKGQQTGFWITLGIVALGSFYVGYQVAKHDLF